MVNLLSLNRVFMTGFPFVRLQVLIGIEPDNFPGAGVSHLVQRGIALERGKALFCAFRVGQAQNFLAENFQLGVGTEGLRLHGDHAPVQSTVFDADAYPGAGVLLLQRPGRGDLFLPPGGDVLLPYVWE